MRKHHGIFSEREKEFNLFRSRSLRNASEMGNDLLLVVIASAFCIISPLVLVLGVLAFILTWLSLRYRVL